MSQYNLDRIFQPRRVAVVGASESTGSFGNALDREGAISNVEWRTFRHPAG